MTFGYMTISHFLRIVYGIGYRVKHIEANRWTWGLCHSLCPQDLFPQGEWVFELRAGVMGVKGAGAGHKMGSTPVNDWQRLLREVTKMHRTGKNSSLRSLLYGYSQFYLQYPKNRTNSKVHPLVNDYPMSTQQCILKQQKGTNYWYFSNDEFQNNYTMWKKPEPIVLILWKEYRLMYSDRRQVLYFGRVISTLEKWLTTSTVSAHCDRYTNQFPKPRFSANTSWQFHA